jgi:hypothetical protein
LALSPTRWDPACGLTYAEWLRDKGVSTPPAGAWTSATRDQVREGRDRDGRRYKTVTDQLGNDVTQHGNDQQSVHIKSPQTITSPIPLKEGSRVGH